MVTYVLTMGFRQGKLVGYGGRVPVLDSYARLSRLHAGKIEKCETQHADNGEVIAELGCELGEEISDPKLSAWNPNVHRPGWDQVMERIASRAVDGLVLWNTDRGWRQCWDLETLFRLIEPFDSFILASSHGHYDLSDYNDRAALRQEVVQNQKASDQASQRISRRFDVLRKRGIPHHQGRVFGWPGIDQTVPREKMIDEDGRDHREPVPAELVERERAALRDGTAALLAGISQMKVCQEWNAAGLRTTRGGLWTPPTLKAVLLRPRNAGLIEHDGEPVSTMRGEDPIVDPGEFEKLRALFAGRRGGARPGLVYLASGVAVCSLCDKTMSGRPHKGTYPNGDKRRQYHCSKQRNGCGKVAADVQAVDREIRGFVISVMSDPKHAATINATRARIGTHLAGVVAQIEEYEQRQEFLAERHALGKLTEKAFDKANDPLAAELERLRGERDELQAESPTAPGVALSREEATARWESAELAEQRAMLITALGRDTLCIAPSSAKGYKTFDKDRVKVKPHKARAA